MAPSGRILQSRYELQGLVERTHTFDLYLARDLHFSGRLWLLKEMKLFSEDPFMKDISRQFQSRASSLARLEHPNLAKIVDYFIEEGISYLVMEHIEGNTMKNILRTQPVYSEGQVLGIANQLGEGIEYLHNLRPKPVLLLNLNPSHIYVHKSGVTLIEYGFSPFVAQMGRIQYLIDDGYGYCAPEMLKSKISVDNRTDLYSLNVILHQLLSGFDPKETPSFSSIRITNPDVSAQLDRLIKKCISSRPASRINSVSVFLKEIGRIPKIKKKAAPVRDDKMEIGSRSSAIRKREEEERKADVIGAKSIEMRKKPVFKTKKIVFNDELDDDIDEEEEKKVIRKSSGIKLGGISKKIILLFLGIVIIGFLIFMSAGVMKSLLTPSPVPTATEDTSGQDYRALGIESYNNGDYIKAIESLTRATNQNPEDALAVIYLQNSYLSMTGVEINIIGVGTSLSGYNESKGEDLLRGIALAQARLNENGANIQIVVEDDQSTIAGALEVTNIFCTNDNILAVIGNIQSDQAKTAAPVYNSKKIVSITPVATCPGMDTLGPYVFRLSGVSSLQPDALAKYCIEQAQFSRVALMYDDTQDYSSGLANMFKDRVIELGGTIEVEETFLTDTLDFNEQVKAIIEHAPEVLFFSGYQKEAANVAVLLRENGSNLQIIGGDALYTPEIVNMGGEAVEGILFTTFFHSDYNNETREFTRVFKSKFRVLPTPRSALSYDALMILGESISNCGKDREAIRDYLASLDGKQKAYYGVTGETSFDGMGNSYRDIFLITVKDGKFILVCKLDL